jgi:hypothetical protein
MRQIALVLFFLATASCANAPAARSPLKEELAAADSPAIEQATRECFTKTGWRVDPLGGVSSGASLVTAFKAKEQSDVYIYPPKTSPRVTGGPEYTDPFWNCLDRALAGGSKTAAGDTEAADAGSGAAQ